MKQCHGFPLELASKPKFSRKKSKFGQTHFASTLETAAACAPLSLGMLARSGFGKQRSGFGALQHRVALCLSSRGQRIRGMNACHRPRMPCAVYQPPMALWRRSGRHKRFRRLGVPSRGCQGPQQMRGEHSAEEGGFSSLQKPLLFSTTGLRPGLNGKTSR